MAYGLKYFNEFKSDDNQLYKIEILEKDYTDVSTEVKTSSQPLIISQSNCKRFDVIQGSSADINLISETSIQFEDLYTDDMQQFQILFYKNNSIIWCGFLDSELYDENYSFYENYQVSFTANDGLNILERLYFFDDNENKYEGLYTVYDIIQIIFNKLNLPYSNLYIGSSSKIGYKYLDEFVDLSLDSYESILHRLKVNTFNYYDELDESMTLREILEGILKPLGLKLKINPFNNSIYIFDLNLLKSGNDITLKKYLFSDYSFVEDVIVTNVNNIFDITNDLKYNGTGQQFNFEPAINKQTLNYSPYAVNPVLDASLDNDSDTYGNEFTDYETVTKYGDGDYSWYEFDYATNSKFEKQNNGHIINHSTLNLGEYENTDIYCKWTNDNNESDKNDTSNIQTVLKTIVTTPLIVKTDNYLRLNLDVYLHTKDNYNDPDEKSNANVVCAYIYCYIKIGDYYFDTSVTDPYATKWTTTKTLSKLPVFIDGYNILNSDNNICDKWVSIKYNYVPFYDGLMMKLNSVYLGNIIGYMEIEFVSYFQTTSYLDSATSDYVTTEYINVKDIRIKNLSVDVMSSSIWVVTNTEPLEGEDVIIESYLNKKVKNEGEDINTIHGCRQEGIERGAFLYDYILGENISTLYLEYINRNGVYDCIENHLLNSVVSNYEKPSVMLTNVNLKSNLICNPILNLFTDSNYINRNNEMWVYGYEFNPISNNIKLNIIEVKEDNLIISNE